MRYQNVMTFHHRYFYIGVVGIYYCVIVSVNAIFYKTISANRYAGRNRTETCGIQLQ